MFNQRHLSLSHSVMRADRWDLKEVKRAVVVRCCTLIRSAQSLLQASLQFYLFSPFLLLLSLPGWTVFTILAMLEPITVSVLLLKGAKFRVTGEIIIS